MLHSVEKLIEAIAQGADVDALDREGRTALFYAARDGDLEVAEELIRHGANVNARDKNESTPLHFAANSYRTGVADVLIKHGAKIDAQDVHGNPPLFRAVFASRGRGDMTKLLLSAGANRTLKNKSGVSPEDLANTIANYNVRQFLN